uniref:Small ribosomal subunit protein uS15 n=1 Tax=Candidatus Aschnera chinzeii TaxID=1485666 RepID=A0AAT9G3Q0_9ENTR|nr:MAG: 30S ribosomal protein S15 [Candidatus Aschnera chinzeii]
MSVSIDTQSDFIANYIKNNKNYGNSEMQIILLTSQLNSLQSHFEKHKKDYHSKRGLLKKVVKRRKLLIYLKHSNINAYNELIEQLGLRK